MPSPRRHLGVADVHRFVRERCFAPADDGLVGVEAEWLVFSTNDLTASVDHATLRRCALGVGPLPGGSTVTFEPGGQLEVSSPPGRGPQAACDVMADDVAVVSAAAQGIGVELVGLGLDPRRRGHRVVDGPRYRAMEAYLDLDGPSGRRMMCDTAALQVNLDIGVEASQARRWRLAHDLGPVVLGAFANSPLAGDRPHGWRSGRAAAWAGIDATRTGPAHANGDQDPVGAWARYALAAHVMLIKVSEVRFEPVGAALPFSRWIAEGHELGHPTVDDLDYHLTTLFPPVRPRGWLELRMIDALPDPWWQVAVAVSAALLDDGEAADRVAMVSSTTSGLWRHAARHGLGHPALAAAARTCFLAAMDALPRLGAGPDLLAATAAYYERFVAHGRCPADDVLDQWRRTGDPLSPPHPCETQPLEALPLEVSWT